MSQISLGRSYGLDKTTVSRNLKWLERRGWITSSPAADARQRQFTLTADGRKQLNLALPHWRKAQAEPRSQMGAAHWDAMFRAFQAVTRRHTRPARAPRRLLAPESPATWSRLFRVLCLVDGLVDLLSGLLSRALLRTCAGSERDRRQSKDDDDAADNLHAADYVGFAEEGLSDSG